VDSKHEKIAIEYKDLILSYYFDNKQLSATSLSKYICEKEIDFPYSSEYFRKAVSKIISDEKFKEENGVDSIENADGSLELSSKRIISVKQLLDLFKIDLNEWYIVSKIVNKWESATNARPQGYIELFQVKVKLERKISNIEDLSKFKEDLKNEIKEYSPLIEPVNYNKIKNESEKNLLNINIFDLHFDKLGWEDETGENYDMSIASERFFTSLSYLCEKASKYNIDRVLLPIGNDFFNYDKAHPFSTTTKGTPQQSDSRWQKSFKKGRKMLSQGIEWITKEIAPVDIMVIPGNHDYEKMFYLGDALECKYENNANVYIDNSPRNRKYYSYGKNLLGFTHGDKENRNTLPNIMASEQSILWAECIHRYFYLGHWHKQKRTDYTPIIPVEDIEGVIVEVMSSLSGNDSFHSEKGYVNSKKSARANLHNFEDGRIANFDFNFK